jgi:non-specific serine/threonine protein kinase
MLEECRYLAGQLGDEVAGAHALHKLGLATLFGGDLSGGVALMEQALARLAALGELNSYVVMGQVQLAMTSSLEGDVDRAAEVAEQARAICEARGESWVLSSALYAMARIEWRRGQLAGAAGLGRESLRIKHTINDLVGIVLVIEQLAWIAASDSQSTRAAVLLGAAYRIWPTVGQPLFGSKYHIAAHEESEERARQAIGGVAFDTAFRHGVDLTLDEAIAFALDKDTGLLKDTGA